MPLHSRMCNESLPYDESDVGVLEVVIDFVELMDYIVWNTSLSQQHVQLSWHPPGHRVDGEADIDTLVSESSGHLSNGILRLGNR